jgi:hypothetical protein
MSEQFKQGEHMLHENEKEKDPVKPPTIGEQEKAAYARRVAEGKAGKYKHGSRTADCDMGKPGDCHEHQDPKPAVEPQAPEAPKA